MIDRKPHPRGMAGKAHSDGAKIAMSKGQKLTWVTQKVFGGPHVTEERKRQNIEHLRRLAATKPASRTYTNARGGRRADLDGTYFRSSWEANYARYLNLLKRLGVIEHWAYEPEIFWFHGIRRGVTNYKPDFRIKYKGDDQLEYIELKGWIVPKDRVKWKRMKKYYPHIKLIVLKAKEYYAIREKWASAIPNWESWESPRYIRTHGEISGK